MKIRGLWAFVSLFVATLVLVIGFRPAAAAPVNLQINFQDSATTPPAGYVRDFGEAFGPRTGAHQGDGAYTYGWINPQTGQPLDLVGNGRNRSISGLELRQNTLIHMQADDLPAGINPGQEVEGVWEIATDNGAYDVTLSAGEAGNYYDSVHRVNVESVLAIDFTPTASSKFRVATVRVNITDGRLTLDAFGGSNTKINYVQIAPAVGPARPAVLGTSPASGATNVAVGTSITANLLSLPNGGLNGSTVNANTIALYPEGQPTNRITPSSVNTTGGGDAITFVPAVALQPNTRYTFEVTSQVQDGAGQAMQPYTMTFTTGSASTPPTTNIRFTKVALSLPSRGYTSLAIGPDDRLYATTNTGQIYNWAIQADGTLTDEQTITALGNRLAIGLAFQPGSTAQNPVLWVSHNANVFPGPHFTGQVSRLTRSGGVWSAELKITGLPRSVKDHLTNSVAFGPDGALYIVQGSVSAMGARDNAWGQQPETLLSAAVLRVNIGALPGGTLNVATGTPGGDGSLLDDNNYQLNEAGLPYNPRAANAPLTLFATGVRNAYDLVWHTNGSLYVPTNGSAGGGNAPGTPGSYSTEPACTARANGAAYTGGAVPAAANITTQEDYLFRVVQGGFYGHPNPTRCEWVLNGGNPTTNTDPGQVGNHYAVGTNPDPNWRGISYNFSFNKSPNGAIEYRSSAVFGGALAGRLLVVRYSQNDDIIVLQPGGAANDIIAAQTGIPGFTGFNNPLDLVEHLPTGSLYVTEYGSEYSNDDNKITLLRPDSSTPPPPTDVPNITFVNTSWTTLNSQNIPEFAFANRLLSFQRIKYASPNNGGGALLYQDTQTLRIGSSGTAPLTITGLTLSDTGRFVLANGEAPTASAPLVIAPGQTYDLVVRFTENSGSRGVRSASLTVASNDPDEPQGTIALAGAYMVYDEGSNEVTPVHIAQTFGYAITLGYPFSSEYIARGDEVLSHEWRRVDSARPVYVRQLAALHGCCSPEAFLRIDGTGGGTLRHDNLYGQSLLPLKQASGTPTLPTEATFNASTTRFTFNIENYSSAQCRDVTNCKRHAVRLWQVRDPNGGIVPNAYFVIQDYIPTQGCTANQANGVCDYNDNVYLVTNIAPVSAQGRIALVKDVVRSPILAGETAAFTLTVTNAGTTPLTNVQVSDAQCTTAPALRPGGDANGSGLLEVGETWVYDCAVTNVLASFTNTATVTALAGALQVSATDTASVVVQQTTACGPLVQEAEAGSLAGKFVSASDPAASGGAYVHAPNGSGSAWNIGSTTRATYCFTVAEAGTYRLKGWTLAATGNDDSFFVSLAGTTNLWTLANGTTYITDDVGNSGGPDPREVTLTPGETQVIVYLREDGARLDKLQLERVAAPAPNTPPVVTVPDAQTHSEGQSVSLAISASDTAGQTLTYSATGLPIGLSINSATGLISGTLGYTNAQFSVAVAFNVTVLVTDNGSPAQSGQAAFTWTVNNVNRPPLLTAPADQNGYVGGALSLALTLAASDPDSDTLTFSAANLPEGITLNGATGVLSGTPTTVQVTNVVLTVTDSGIPNLSAQAAFTWTISATAPPPNTPPVVQSPGNQTSTQGRAIQPLTISASDTAGQTLTYSAAGLPDGLVIHPATGQITGTPTTIGSGSVTVTVTDSGTPALSAQAAFTWTVTGAPLACAGLTQEAESGQLAGKFVIGADAAASGGAYIYAPNGSGSVWNIGSTTRATYCFTVSQAGTYRLKGTVNAPNGNDDSFFVSLAGTTNLWTLANGTTYITDYVGNSGGPDPREVALTPGETQVIVYLREDGARIDKLELELIQAANTPPVVQSPGNQTSVQGSAILPVAISASDTAGQTLTYSAAGLPDGLAIHPASGQITGTPTKVETSSVTVTVTDSGTPALSAQTTFTWAVSAPAPVNLPPLITAPGDQTHFEASAILPVAISASDPEGTPLAYSAAGLPDGLSIDPTSGQITGTPTTPAVYTVTVTVTDSGTPALSAQTTFTWAIQAKLPENAAPSITAPGDQTSVQASAILPVAISASDPEGTPLAYSAAGLPDGLSIDPTSGQITGTPTTPAVYTVTVTVADSGTPALSAQTTFTWTVTAPPE